MGLALFLMLGFLFLPESKFSVSHSSVLYDKDYQLLSARVAEDEQWRFPPGDSVPERFATCVRYFEDEYFYYHIGFNPISLFRATYQNIKEGKVVSGGSTISMQVVRLSSGSGL